MVRSCHPFYIDREEEYNFIYMEKLFARQQALSLTGLSSGQLSRLDKSGLIVPTKIGSKVHPAVLYSFRQILELRIYSKLVNKLSVGEIKVVICYIRKNQFHPSLFSKYIVLLFNSSSAQLVSQDELGVLISQTTQVQPVITLKVISPIGEIHQDLP